MFFIANTTSSSSNIWMLMLGRQFNFPPAEGKNAPWTACWDIWQAICVLTLDREFSVRGGDCGQQTLRWQGLIYFSKCVFVKCDLHNIIPVMLSQTVSCRNCENLKHLSLFSFLRMFQRWTADVVFVKHLQELKLHLTSELLSDIAARKHVRILDED